MNSARGLKRNQVVAGLAAIGVLLSATLILTRSADAGGEFRVRVDRQSFEATRNLTGSELRSALEIPKLSWTYDEKTDEVAVLAPNGHDELEGCPEDLRPLRVLLPDGTAYCIEGAGESAQSDYMASDVVVRLAQNRIPSDTERALMLNHSEQAFVNPESDQLNQLLEEEQALMKQLTPTEKAAIDEGRQALEIEEPPTSSA